MEVRKVVKSGNFSHVIALPKGWLEEHHLKKGDKVYVDETESHDLIISTRMHGASKPQKKELKINIEKLDEFSLRRLINAAYISDYSNVIIKGEGVMDKLDTIKNTVALLIAFEVVEESHDSIEAKSFLDPKAINVKSIIRRIDRVLRSMIEDLGGCYRNKKMAKIVHDRDIEINKLGYLVFKILKSSFKDRSLARELGLTTLDIGVYSQVNMHLEKMGDKIKLIAKVISEAKKNQVNAEDFKRLASDIEAAYINIMKAFFTNNKLLADEVARQRQRLHKASENFYLKKENVVCSEIKTHFKAFLSHVVDLSRVIRYMLD